MTTVKEKEKVGECDEGKKTGTGGIIQTFE